MRLPFTTEQFFTVFRRYNEAVWPAQWMLVGFAILAVGLALHGSKWGDRVISGVVALLWLWMGVVYHLMFFVPINRGAIVFAAAFVVEGALFAIVGAWHTRLRFRPRRDLRGIGGGLFVAYALIGYPALGYLLGHRYPAAPTFGLPCPTTIFTFGLLLWVDRPIPWALLILPLLWALTGTAAVSQLGMREDLGLLVAALTTMLLISRRRGSNHRDTISGIAEHARAFS